MNERIETYQPQSLKVVDDAPFYAMVKRLSRGQSLPRRIELLTETLYQAWVWGDDRVRAALQEFTDHVVETGEGEGGRGGQ